MPTEGDLVRSIIDLLEFNAAQVSDARWDYDITKLLEAIDAAVELSAAGKYLPTSVGGSDAPATSPEIGDEGQPEHRHKATTDRLQPPSLAMMILDRMTRTLMTSRRRSIRTRPVI